MSTTTKRSVALKDVHAAVDRAEQYIKILPMYLEASGICREWHGKDFKVYDKSPFGHAVWYFFWNGEKHELLQGPAHYIAGQLKQYGSPTTREIADILINTPAVQVDADLYKWYEQYKKEQD